MVMKIFLITIFVFLFSNCSFDNKTGIWNNSNEIIEKKADSFKNFKKLYTENKLFDQIILPNNDFKISLDPIKINLKWPDEFYQKSNNLENFSYKNLNKQIFKSKKLSKYKIKEKILFDGENLLISDIKGNIFVYSTKFQKTIFKYNFYKKKFKGLTKDLYIIVEGNIIYVADNLGYTYAINHVNQKILWAKNFKIPFRSNIKIFKNNIILADTSNSIYFIDKLTGNIFKTLPTEEVTLKNEFINSLAIDENSLFYLNTFGSLYSINSKGKINWFLNINQYSEVDASNSFGSNPLTLYKNKVIVSADKFLYVFNSIDGSRIVKSPITSIVKPLISNENIFMITKNNLLVNINLSTGNINYSLDISSEIANFLDTKKKTIYIKTLSILDNNLYIFLDNSFYVKFSPGGKILSVEKLPAKLGSYPIFINDSILYINEKNRFVIVN